jgi:hypothetical protein
LLLPLLLFPDERSTWWGLLVLRQGLPLLLRLLPLLLLLLLLLLQGRAVWLLALQVPPGVLPERLLVVARRVVAATAAVPAAPAPTPAPAAAPATVRRLVLRPLLLLLAAIGRFAQARLLGPSAPAVAAGTRSGVRRARWQRRRVRRHAPPASAAGCGALLGSQCPAT